MSHHITVNTEGLVATGIVCIMSIDSPTQSLSKIVETSMKCWFFND
jgi:hypothetical protein